jgi:hypothetical protein
MEDYKKMYEQLRDEFEQYKKESVKWGVEDFTEYDHPTHTITEEQAQMALEYMIYKHDAEVGITWYTIEYYLADYGTPRKVDRFIVTDKSGRSAKPYEMTHDQVALIGAGESWQEELNEWLDDCDSGDIFDQHNIKIQVL